MLMRLKRPERSRRPGEMFGGDFAGAFRMGRGRAVRIGREVGILVKFAFDGRIVADMLNDRVDVDREVIPGGGVVHEIISPERVGG